MKELGWLEKFRYLLTHGVSLFWMRPGTRIKFLFNKGWYTATIERLYEHRGVIQVGIHEIDCNFASDYLSINKTSVLPSKVRRIKR